MQRCTSRSAILLLLLFESVTSWSNNNVGPLSHRRHLVDNQYTALHSVSPTTTVADADTLERNHGGILYRTSVFNKEEFALIAEDVERVLLSEESSLSVAKHRLGAQLSPNSRAVQSFRRGSLHKLVQQMTSSEYELSEHVTVEIRSYEKQGACMAWHSDDILYCDPPQIEVVWTLENSSDCLTMWKTANGQVVQSVETEKNSVILLRGGGVEHCVTSLKRGKRVIIKCVYASKHATFVSQTNDAAQFEATKTSRRKRKR